MNNSSPNAPESELLALTYQQAGARLGIHPETVARLVRAGKLPSVPGLGRSRRISVESLRRYVNGSADQKTK